MVISPPLQDQIDTLTFQNQSLKAKADRFEEALKKSTEEQLKVDGHYNYAVIKICAPTCGTHHTVSNGIPAPGTGPQAPTRTPNLELWGTVNNLSLGLNTQNSTSILGHFQSSFKFISTLQPFTQNMLLRRGQLLRKGVQVSVWPWETGSVGPLHPCCSI